MCKELKVLLSILAGKICDLKFDATQSTHINLQDI